MSVTLRLRLIIILGLTSAFLIGCGTTSPKPMVLAQEFKSKVVPLKKEEVVVEKPESVYMYGSFKVEVFKDRQRIVRGAVENPGTEMLYDSEYMHVFEIDYGQKTLIYYRRDDSGKHVAVIRYVVVTPSISYLPQEVVRGVVTKIDMAPIWYPTKNLRLKDPGLPDGPIPFGHPQNEMGAGRFHATWNVPESEAIRWEAIRVHGTSGYPINFHKIDTAGCVRVENRAIINLVELLGPDAVPQGFEMIIHGTSPYASLAE